MATLGETMPILYIHPDYNSGVHNNARVFILVHLYTLSLQYSSVLLRQWRVANFRTLFLGTELVWSHSSRIHGAIGLQVRAGKYIYAYMLYRVWHELWNSN